MQKPAGQGSLAASPGWPGPARRQQGSSAPRAPQAGNGRLSAARRSRCDHGCSRIRRSGWITLAWSRGSLPCISGSSVRTESRSVWPAGCTGAQPALASGRSRRPADDGCRRALTSRPVRCSSAPRLRASRWQPSCRGRRRPCLPAAFSAPVLCASDHGFRVGREGGARVDRPAAGPAEPARPVSGDFAVLPHPPARCSARSPETSAAPRHPAGDHCRTGVGASLQAAGRSCFWCLAEDSKADISQGPGGR